MFDLLLIQNRRSAIAVMLGSWLIGVLIALPGQFIAIALMSIVFDIPAVASVLIAIVAFHALVLLCGPFLLRKHVALWILKLGTGDVRDPGSDDAGIIAAAEAVAIASGRSVPTIKIIDDDRPNAATLRIDDQWIILVTSAVGRLPYEEREALFALAIGRTLGLSPYFNGLQSWVVAPMVFWRLVPVIVQKILGLLFVALVVVLRVGIDVAPGATMFAACALVPFFMLHLSHVVVRGSFERFVQRPAVLSSDAAAIGLLRNPHALRMLFARSAQEGVKSRFWLQKFDLLFLPIWMLPSRWNRDSFLLRERVVQLDRIDSIGAASGFSAKDVVVRRAPLHLRR
jgi:hypothetical protein